MPTLSMINFANKLKKKRGEHGIRETAKEIDISPATLSRVERANFPDLKTFKKICQWLEVDPGEVLGFKPSGDNTMNVAVNFRKDQEINTATSEALAKMIVAANKSLLDSQE